MLAAVEGQLALRSHLWPDGVEIKVRMGLHTGQAVAHDGRYTGLAVHRAARIGAAGHGGQILVSQATQTLLEDEEEDLHVSLGDLGDSGSRISTDPFASTRPPPTGCRTRFRRFAATRTLRRPRRLRSHRRGGGGGAVALGIVALAAGGPPRRCSCEGDLAAA